VEAELVNRIVEQVLVALRQRGGSALTGAPASAGARVGVGQSRPQFGPPAKVFITAQMLQQRIRASTGNGVVELAHNEYLTPNAVDLIQQRHLTVHKAPKPSPSHASVNPAAAVAGSGGEAAETPSSPALSVGAVGVVSDRTDRTTEGLLDALACDGVTLVECNQTDCWIRNLQAMGRSITDGALAAGVAILPYAADAMVLANKMPGIRAVQGTRLQSVSAALRHFDANMLILETAFSSFHEMRTMIRQFASERTASPMADTLLAAVAGLERT
jgi:ribose 5-phosphate isomerase RpiB